MAGAVLGLALGAIAWMSLAAGGPNTEDGFNPFLGVCLLIAVALGAVVRRRPGLAAAAAPVAAIVLAPWTASRGDRDGLWILIFPMLVGVAFVLGAVGEFVAVRCPSRWADVGDRWLRPAAAVATVAAVIAIAVLPPDPYAHLRDAAADFAVPAVLTPDGPVRRLGDPLCTSSCGVALARTYTGDVGDSCQPLREALRAWSGADPQENGPCVFDAVRDGVRLSASRTADRSYDIAFAEL